MHKLLVTTFAALGVLALAGVVSEPAWSFQCDPGKAGKGTCSCSGTSDCNDMRHSMMCGGSLNCGNGKCTCTAALTADPGGTKKPKVFKLPTTKLKNATQQ
jgi:hypothetical protein